MAIIFHITTAAAWEQARRAGDYRGDTLATEGFIHCSRAEQVNGVVERLFRGRSDLVLLHIERDRLAAPVVDENLEGGTELFPHVYGPIELEAVVDVRPLAADGEP